MMIERVPESRKLHHWPDDERCPPASWLDGLMMGDLGAGLQQRLEAHLSACAVCQQRLLDVGGSDSIEALARQCLRADEEAGFDAADRVAIGQLIDRLGRIAEDGPAAGQLPQSAADLATRLAELQPFFDPPASSGSLGRIDRFEILEVLGAGATGVVFRARQTSLDRFVVLKVLRPSLGTQARERFLHEARAAAAIEHDNVVTILEVGQWRELAFFTMPWLPGETLQVRVERQRVLDPQEVVEVSRQIAAGLSVAHRHGLVHRDVKPANIWIEESTGRVRLLDFGLARIADDDQHFTQTGMVAGTPGYMSPQQAAGESIDQRSDLFSLGCVMYRMATGRMAFVAPNVLATLQLVRTHHPIPADEVNPEVPAGLSLLIQCLLAKDPNQRPQSAEQVIAALDSPPRDWPFALPGARQVDRNDGSPRAHASKSSWGRIGRGIGLCLVCLALGGAGWWFAPQVIRIVTDQGVVEIETEDPDIQIEVLQQGRRVRVIDTRTTQQFEICSGEYVLRGIAPESEVQLSTDRLVVKRGGKQVVQARLLPPPTIAGTDTGGPVADSGESAAARVEPLWAGKPLREYLGLLRVERHRERVAEILRALDAMYADEYQQEVFAVLKGVLSQSYVDRIAIGSDLGPNLASLIVKLPAESQVDLLLTYLRSQDREGDPWVDFWLMGIRGKKEEVQQLQQRRDEILEALLSQVQQASGPSPVWTNVLAKSVLYAEISLDDRPDVLETIATDLSQASADRLILLARIAPDTPDLADHITAYIGQPRSFPRSPEEAELVRALLAMGPDRYQLRHLLPSGSVLLGADLTASWHGQPSAQILAEWLQAMIDCMDSAEISLDENKKLLNQELIANRTQWLNFLHGLKQQPIPDNEKQRIRDLYERIMEKLEEKLSEPSLEGERQPGR
ncbi:MAG: hypothetical protein KatS3mg111_0621 [Pirellulaceae bacterium]|nr:MAG: hypothetical protein KatS3mg111_0621 [Pirellulaceae bacterium]